MFQKMSLAMMLLCVTGLTLMADQKPAATQPVYAHNADYTRLTGRLLHKDLEGGFWEIKYIDPASPDAAKDANHGYFVLGNPAALKGYSDGDAVQITGKISDKQASDFQAGTMYEIRKIEKVGKCG
jgi:hypothetical protein